MAKSQLGVPPSRPEDAARLADTASAKLLIVSGRITVNANTATPINFIDGSLLFGSAAKEFAVPPTIATNISSAASASTARFASASDVTNTGFTLQFQRSTATATGIDWIAIGVSA